MKALEIRVTGSLLEMDSDQSCSFQSSIWHANLVKLKKKRKREKKGREERERKEREEKKRKILWEPLL